MRFGAALIRVSGLLPLVESLEAHRKNLLRILVYHRIGDTGATNGLLDPSLLSATPEQFEQQMRFLREHYRLLSICDLLAAIEAHEPLPPKSVMVTFDDGYHDFLDTAWPILERYQIPSLMFLATGFLSPENQVYWWDRLYQGIINTHHTSLSLPPDGDFILQSKIQRWRAFNKLKKQLSTMANDCAITYLDQIMERLDVKPQATGLLLNWPEVRYLGERGCYLAAHTRSHPILSRIPVDDALTEINTSQQDISRETGTVLPVLAYPSGHSKDFSEALAPLLCSEGYKLAMSSIPGINVFPSNNYLGLKRIGLSPRVSLSEFRIVLTGIYHLYCRIQAGLFHRD
jgi:peptidoglycan/xylan/chitin deacetylase (PgdA/CDA1 family)